MAHLFRDCPYASRVWAASSLGIRTSVGDNISIHQWVINWLSLLKKLPNPVASISVFVSILWHIWCARKKLVFQNVPIYYYGLLNLKRMDADNNVQVEQNKWKGMTDLNDVALGDMDNASLLRNHFPFCLVGALICQDHIRIKCDVSWKTSLRAMTGWFLQDKTGFRFRVGRAAFWAKSALQVEAMAMKYACEEAISLGYSHINATSDCLNLVLQLNGCGAVHQDVAPILRALLSLVSLCHCFSLSHCPRYLNRIARSIAKAIN